LPKIFSSPLSKSESGKRPEKLFPGGGEGTFCPVDDRAEVVRQLLRWFERRARDLPWRRGDPHAVWAAETMLQQTQAATAGAAASIAFNEPAPAVDGNVSRVLARLHAVSEPADSAAGRRRLWELAAEWIRLVPASHEPQAEDPEALPAWKRRMLRRGRGAWNQALMELGALACQPAAPACAEYPLAPACLARTQGAPEKLPARSRRAKTVARQAAAFVLERRGRFLVRARSEGLGAGTLWEFPNCEIEQTTEAAFAAAARVLDLPPAAWRKLGLASHSVTVRRAALHALHARAAEPIRRRVRRDGFRWLARRRLAELAFSAPHRRIIDTWLMPVQERAGFGIPPSPKQGNA